MKTFWLAGADRADPIYREWMELRRRVLREPLGLTYTDADLEAERDERHLLATEEGSVIGGLVVRSKGPSSGRWKIRQVAVTPARQGSGIGRLLMETVAREALKSEIHTLVLHSREAVCGFYEKLGYRVEGEPFLELGIRHRRMSVSL